MSKGFAYKKCSSQFYRSIPTVSNKICWSRSIKVSEILSVAIVWLLGCRHGLHPNPSLSLLTTEATADVSAWEILSVLSKIVFNTWAFQLMTQIRIVILQHPWESLPSARGLQTCIHFSREPSVWQIGGLGIFRMKLPSKKNHFHQQVCDKEQSYVEQWPCQVIAGESSYFSLLRNTLSVTELLAINLPFYCFFSPQTHFMG